MAALNDPTRILMTGHLTTREGFMKGVKKTWDHPWTDPSLETTEETWTVARTGLTRLACRATDG